ncbi:MAG: 2,3-bisphosphoglycerate-independent phosphoglycerate mutase [Lachnospirales bacterium]
MSKTTMLMILDGYGSSNSEKGNAIKFAKKPNLDKILSTYPTAEGQASGLNVGLPDGQMGNSEVGHLNIGAGRIIYQDLTKITKSIEDEDFYEKSEFLDAINNAKKHGTKVHLYGLLSTGGVHSHITHVYALLELAKRNNFNDVYVHCFMDGRDTPPTSGKGFVANLEKKMKEIGVGKIATIAGRYYAMDRDTNWDRIELAYKALVLGEGQKANSAVECMENTYSKGKNDEFVLPTVIDNNGLIGENDSIIFFNFRPDRAREITRSFCMEDFPHFERKKGYFPVKYICFTQYDVTIPNTEIVFKKDKIENTLGEYISTLGKTQLRIAETEKYAHVTFFFNGGVEEPYKGEDRILIPSPKVATYDLKPEMSAYEVAEKLVESIKSQKYDLIIINFANPDMVGHTGVYDAAVKAIEAVDACVGKAMDAILEVDGQFFLCADHGNADQLVDPETDEPHTAHTTNPVPFTIVNCKKAKGIKEGGKLSDIAPTLLDMMDIEQPKEMEGSSLLIK